MKKYSLIYLLSFISYIPAFFSLPFMTARTWADLLGLLFIICCCYQLLYILFLRKKEDVSLPRSISRLFLYASFVLIIIAGIWIGNLYFNGYTPTAFLSGEKLGPTVYGLEALKEDGFTTYLSLTAFFIGIIYTAMYIIISKTLNKKPQ